MKRFVQTVALVLLLVSGFAGFAGAWAYHGPKNKVKMLIVTANYDQPRLLAELIQSENRQPVLYVPAKGREGKIVFCPPMRRGGELTVEEKDLAGFVYKLGAERIIVLGDERFIDTRYLKALGKSTPVFVASGEDWQTVAETLTPMLNLTYLSKNFAKLRPRVIAARNAPAPEPKEEEAPAAGDNGTPETMTDDEAKTEPAEAKEQTEFAPMTGTEPAPAAPKPAADPEKTREPEVLPGAND